MRLENFSSGYWLAPELNVTSHGGKAAIIQDSIFDELVAEIGDPNPVAFIGGRRYQLRPNWWVPSHIVALPEDDYSHSTKDAVLISKPNQKWVFV